MPFGPAAVSLYVVVARGKTTVLPEGGNEPTPLSMLTEVALVVDQVSVAVPSELSGVAAKETVGAEATGAVATGTGLLIG